MATIIIYTLSGLLLVELMNTPLKHGLHDWTAWPGAPLAIAAALLFGASTPFAKHLLNEGMNSWLLAGLLYLGSGTGLGLIYLMRRTIGAAGKDAPLQTADIPWLLVVILSGGVAGPVLLMFGLASTPASSASLLLNFEGLATMAIAWVAFRENVDRRLLIGAAAILAGGILLSWTPGQTGFGTGSLAIAGACIAWGVDNNVTRKLSSADPLQIALIKGLAAGMSNLALALGMGARLPVPPAIANAAVIGFFGYGLSLVLFVLGLRYLGTARTSAYFSTAPFAGAALSVLMLDEPFTPQLAAAGLLMAIGVYLHLTEIHDHEHIHEMMAHEHRHIHDQHHQHQHGTDDPPYEPHTHWHVHEPFRHRHAHYPDLHHRHQH